MRLWPALGLLLAGCTVPVTLPYAPQPPNAPVEIGTLPQSGGGAMLLGNDLTISCTGVSPPGTRGYCVGGYPWTVPAGQTLCMTHMYLQNKFPVDPLSYGGSMHAMYLEEDNITVSSHHPDVHFDPPLPFFSGQKLKGYISNAQSESQHFYAFEQGFLVPAGHPCIRKEL